MIKPCQPRWDQRAGAARNAGRELPRVAAAYFAHIRELMSGAPALESLHAARLATKRLRYTLELFRACYGPGLRVRLKVLARAQQTLGDLNDAVVTAAMLPARMPARAALLNRAQQLAGEFLTYWSRQLDAPGEERRWLRYLSRPLPPRARG